jgi:hypothetical protein
MYYRRVRLLGYSDYTTWFLRLRLYPAVPVAWGEHRLSFFAIFLLGGAVVSLS